MIILLLGELQFQSSFINTGGKTQYASHQAGKVLMLPLNLVLQFPFPPSFICLIQCGTYRSVTHSHALAIFPELRIPHWLFSVFLSQYFHSSLFCSLIRCLQLVGFLLSQDVNTSQKIHPLMQPKFSFECDTLFCRNGELGIIHEENKEQRDFLLQDDAQAYTQDVYFFPFFILLF